MQKIVLPIVALLLAGVLTAADLVLPGAVYLKTGETFADTALPPPTIDALLARPKREGELLGWLGNDALLVQTLREKRKILQRLSLVDGTLTPIAEAPSSSPAPDGRKIIEVADQAGWVIRDLTTGRTVAVARPDIPGEIDRGYAPVWSADSRYVAVVARGRPTALPTEPAIREVNGTRIMDFDELAQATPVSTAHIALVDTQTLSSSTALHWHEVSERIGYVVWDHTGVYFASAKFMVKEPYTAVSYLPFGGEPREVYRTRGRMQTLRPIPSPDGRWLAVGIDVDTRRWDAFVSIALVDPKTGAEVKRLTHDLPVLAYSMEWSRDGDQIHCVTRQGGLDQLASVRLDGTVTFRTEGLRKHFNLKVSPDGTQFAYQTEDGYARKDIRTLRLTEGRQKVALVVDDPTKEFRLGSFSHLRSPGDHGIDLYGYLFLPPDFDPTKTYPLIVDVHGGGSGSSLYLQAPLTATIARGSLEWHVWAALGYVVLVPDYRSTGYYGPVPAWQGRSRSRDGITDDVNDVVSAARFLSTQPFIDPRRLGIIGHSAGGARTYNLLTSHALFAAAIVNEGAGPDRLSMTLALTTGGFTGREFEGITADGFGATLSNDPELYKQNVMFDAYRNKAPTLIMVGNEKKGGVGHLPFEVLFTIMKAYRTPVRMLSFVDEGHNYSTPESSRLAFDEARKWFEHYLAARP